MARSQAPPQADPSTPRKPQARGLQSARNLMTAATTLFIAQGVEATTVDQIVLQAGIAKGTFYHHFASKAALLAALQESVIADFEAHIDQAVSACPPENLWLRLETWSRAACEGYIHMEPLYNIVFGGEPPRWTASDTQCIRDLTALLKEGHAQGLWTVDHPHLTATFMFRGLLGVIDDLFLTGKKPSNAQRHVVRLVRNLVTAPPPQSTGSVQADKS